MPFLEAAAVVWAISAWPAYAGAVLFGVPLALLYLRFGVISWFAYWGGGLLCALVTAACLILAGSRDGTLTQLNGFGFFIILYGLVGGSCVRATLFGFRTSKQIRLALVPSTDISQRPNERLRRLKGGWALALLVIMPPIGPLIWLFIASHPYGIPSGPEQAIISILVFVISFAAPLYIEGLLFSVPLVLAYRRFGVTSWVFCAAGGAANGLVALLLLRAMGESVDILTKPTEVLAFVAGYGALSALFLRIFSRTSGTSESSRISRTEP
ncbi:MAG: hypothetical protein WB676_04030 [Bryobacteraceae bacterium]